MHIQLRPSFQLASRTLAACLLTALTGCAVLPEPTGTQVQAQALGHATIPAGWGDAASTADVVDGWLTSFNDPALTQLVHEALANNPDLQIAAARLDQANAQLDIAQAQLKPSIGILGRSGSKPVADLVPLLSGAMLRMSWEVDLWGRLRYGRNAAMAARDASDADFRYAQQSLAAAVTRAWFLASETRQQQALADEMVAAAQTLVELAEQRRRIGISGESDVVTARASLSDYQNARQQIELAHLQSLRALELLLGRYPSASMLASATLPAVPAPVPAGIPMDVLNRRLDMLAAERRVAAAFDKVGEAKAAMLPSLSLSAGYGRLSNEVLETRSGLEQTISSITGTAAVPVYSGGALTGQVELRTAEQKQAVADYARRALTALGEVEGALSSERILGERERILKVSEASSREALRLEQTAYRVGKSDLRAVNQRQLAVHAAEVALLTLQSERLSRRVDLYLALGGSFELPQTGTLKTGGQHAG
ncbi:efflux transporter outer membrane subunit [Stenotrophomonas sp. SY1]|uniref:efflux transporter outer membrane subunit n=1 Tax=Stenotrophomonas sp. SY1 TaxID=477235 RepID=UPI001E2CEACE|nr:efflux transporter outer membrane subunit [Stenotrophomonas sp. SY1]MCD9087028.1 efflux transporter outer membrane subunit [Stenotrophomonas sp. SY1]